MTQNYLSDRVIFDRYLNVQLGGRLLKVQYTKLIVMPGAEHTVSWFLNDVSKMPIVHPNDFYPQGDIQYFWFCYISQSSLNKFKSRYKYFYNKNIGIFSENDTRMSWYFMGMHRYSSIIKVLQPIILSA